jgi:hypothetical protein
MLYDCEWHKIEIPIKQIKVQCSILESSNPQIYRMTVNELDEEQIFKSSNSHITFQASLKT